MFLRAAAALAHGEVEVGPNGGRILEFNKDATTLCELTVKDGKFHIALLDKDMKPVALAAQEPTATSGDKTKPEKLAVEKKDGKFVVPTVKEGGWIIFQYRDAAKARPEWLCVCAQKK